jgi:hypothetical protein
MKVIYDRIASTLTLEQKTDSDLDIPGPLKDTSSLVRFIVIETICMILAVLS